MLQRLRVLRHVAREIHGRLILYKCFSLLVYIVYIFFMFIYNTCAYECFGLNALGI